MRLLLLLLLAASLAGLLAGNTRAELHSPAQITATRDASSPLDGLKLRVTIYAPIQVGATPVGQVCDSNESYVYGTPDTNTLGVQQVAASSAGWSVADNGIFGFFIVAPDGALRALIAQGITIQSGDSTLTFDIGTYNYGCAQSAPNAGNPVPLGTTFEVGSQLHGATATPSCGDAVMQRTGNIFTLAVSYRSCLGAPTAPPTPSPAPTPKQSSDPCFSRYPGGGTQRTSGKTTSYDRAASLYQVCEGFGASKVGVKFTPAMQCAIIAAAAVYAGTGEAAILFKHGSSLGCAAPDIATQFRNHNWAGLAKSAACSFFGDVIAPAVGIFAAGATSATGPGAVAIGVNVYKALAAGIQLVCGGLFTAFPKSIGDKLEANHEAGVAMDIVKKGKCLSEKQGHLGISWSAVKCG